EDIGLGLDEPRCQLIEGVHENRLGSAARARGRDVPELLLQSRDHQDRTVTPHREIVQRVVPRKNGYRGGLRRWRFLRLHGVLPAGSGRAGPGGWRVLNEVRGGQAAGLAGLRSWWRGRRVVHLCSLAWGTSFARQESRSADPEVFPYGGIRS